MTIDERLDRLTERHEALTQSREIFSHDLRDLAQIARQSAASIGELAASIDTLGRIAGDARTSRGQSRRRIVPAAFGALLTLVYIAID